MKSILRCLIVEDQLILRELLVAMLDREQGVEVVASAGDIREGVAKCLEHNPELLVLDLALPDGDGSIVARALLGINPSAKVIVLSSFASSAEWPAELSHQLVAILDKSRAFEDLVREINVLKPECISLDKTTEINLEQLTMREREILRMIGSGYSSKQVGVHLCISLRTVETHRRNICQKLGKSGAALIHLASLHVLKEEGSLNQ